MSSNTLSQPLTDIQTRVWVLDHWAESRTPNVVSCLFELNGELDVAALSRAFSSVVARHPVLSATIELRGDELMMHLGHGSAPALQFVDLEHTADKDAHRERLLEAETVRRFELSKVAPLRGFLFRMDRARHQFFLLGHPIAVDRRSVATIVEQISRAYGAVRQGLEPAWTPSIEAANQRTVLTNDGFSAWNEALAGAPTSLAVPCDRPRNSRNATETAIFVSRFDEELMASLRAVGAGSGSSLPLVLRSGFAALVSRLSGQPDLLLGVATDERAPEAQGAVGPLTDLAPIRIDCAGNPRFADFVSRQQRAEAEWIGRPRISFRRLVEALDRTPQPGTAPLVQVSFDVAPDTSDPSLQLDNVRVESRPVPSGASMLDLALRVVTGDSGATTYWTYRTDLFSPATIGRYASAYETLLRGIASDPTTHLAELPLLNEEERTRVLMSWNSTEVARSPNETILDLLDRTTSRLPEAPAVIGGDRILSYLDLRARSNQLAHSLRRLGVRRGSRVAVSLERSIDLVTGLVGILKAGAAYVPLDATYPTERLAYMMTNAEASVLVTHSSRRAELPPFSGVTLCVDEDAPRIAAEPVSDVVDDRIGWDDLCYVMYTSGSTGRPKGVAMPHRAMYNLICWQLEQGPCPSSGRTLQYTPVSFDVSFQEIFSTLAGGGSLVVIADAERRDPERLLARLQSDEINRLFLPFVALQQLCETAQRTDQAPSSLCEVITAGEQLQITPALRWFFSRTGCSLENQYGPSETHVVTAYRLNGAPETWPLLPSIGWPIANTQVYILDEHLQPTPIGVPGELVITGHALADGYLNAPEITSTRFVPHPLVATQGARVYRTGDLARYLADGSIEFLGRRDSQVKLRGFRIELGEIETALTQDPDIRESAVVLREDAPGEKRLVAYVTSNSSTLSVTQLRSQLVDRLPEHMVPSAFVVLPQLPLTPSGKVDRRALPPPATERPVLDGAYVAPRTSIERRVAGVWESVLGVRPIGVNDSVFELGAQSLQIVRAHPLLREILGNDLSIAELFEFRTIAQLSRRFERLTAAPSATNELMARAQKQREAMAQMARRHSSVPKPVRS